MGDEIKVTGSKVIREMVGGIRKSREQFGNAMGSQMGSLNDVQGVEYQWLGQYGERCGE